jgi:hypothetical protein
MQDIAESVQLRDGRLGDKVRNIPGIAKSDQEIGVKKISH